MKIIKCWRLLVIGVVIFLTLSSCATNDHSGKIIGAGVGGLAGVGLAKVFDKDPGKWALIGAGIGTLAGAAYDYSVKKTKEAPEVENDYRKEHEGQLPPETIVTKYLTRTDPSNVVKRGGELDFYSEIEIVKGTSSYATKDQIQEELIIYNNIQGVAPLRNKKVVDIDPNYSGAYETKLAFKFKPSDNLEQGKYGYKKILYLNDKPVKDSEGKFQVVIVDQQIKLAIVGE